jgi:hypothetical protein
MAVSARKPSRAAPACQVPFQVPHSRITGSGAASIVMLFTSCQSQGPA